MRVVSLLVACCLASAGSAAAQPAPGADPIPPPTAPPAVPPTPLTPTTPPAAEPGPAAAPEARDDAAWQLYHEAFAALLEGKRKRAADLIVRLEREHAGHPAAVRAAASPLAAPGVLAKIRAPHREEPSSGASAELALFQTLHGLAFGIELCVVLECDSGEAFVGLSLAGGGTGAIASLKAVEHITSGQRALLNSGTAWGAYNAILGILAIAPDDERSIAGMLLAGQSVGLATGALLFSSRPSAGQVALANSGGQWGATLVALTILAASPSINRRDFSLTALVGADAGIGMGAYLARQWPEVSRAQTLVIDAGGIVGLVGGGGLGILISGDSGDRTTPAMAAVGAAVGLGVTAYLTRGWYGDGGGGDGPRAMLMPAEHGRGGLLGLSGAW